MFRIYKNSLNLEKLTRINNDAVRNAIKRFSSSLPKTHINDAKKSSLTFNEMIKGRKREADKSLVVQVNSESSYQELFNYCSQFGAIKSAFHYTTTEEQNHFILLEFQEISECDEALRTCQFQEGKPGVPVISPFLWFKAKDSKQNNKKVVGVDPPSLCCDQTRLLADDQLNDILRSAENLNDQMLILYKTTHLSDLGIRTRFIAAKQLESALKGIFPHVQAHPFGSSVNGFGKMGCDLDLILCVDHEKTNQHSDLRLIFHTKEKLSNGRSQTQRQMEALGDILHLFLPGITNVRRILQARVPIIKFNHECLELEVDLSMTNLTGVHMSELLYLYGEIDDRVRPLTFCIRKWAKVAGLTNPSPGRWISNFSLTILVLFFLQNLKKPILPSLNHLTASATGEDIRIVDDSINCTFLRDLKNLQFQQKNEDKLSFLLIQFFEFYTQFDFAKRSVSLTEGSSVLKIDHSAMWIVNPFEPLTNVSKNVSFEELERFKFEAKNAAWVLESASDKTDDIHWGLLNLFKSNKQAIVKPQMFFKSRLVNVTDIFSENEDPTEKVQFKNNIIKSEVKAIRQSTKKELNKMEFSRGTSSMKNKRK